MIVLGIPLKAKIRELKMNPFIISVFSSVDFVSLVGGAGVSLLRFQYLLSLPVCAILLEQHG
jgi:hypothetical protein